MKLFTEIIEKLNQHDVDYIVVGGLATVLHGYNRLTGDIDIIINLSEKNILNAIHALSELDYKPRIPVDPTDFANEKTRQSWIEEKNLTVLSFFSDKHPMFAVDIFSYYPIEYSELNENAVTKKLQNSTINVYSIEDLIRLKEISGRDKDKHDINALKLIKEKHND